MLGTKEIAYHITLFDWDLFWAIHEYELLYHTFGRHHFNKVSPILMSSNYLYDETALNSICVSFITKHSLGWDFYIYTELSSNASQLDWVSFPVTFQSAISVSPRHWIIAWCLLSLSVSKSPQLIHIHHLPLGWPGKATQFAFDLSFSCINLNELNFNLCNSWCCTIFYCLYLSPSSH